MKSIMTTVSENWDGSNGCPLHQSKIKKVYTFGRYGDAEVYTFKGCKCAVCINEASLLCGPALGHEITCHNSYSGAEGRARLIVASEDVINNALA